MFKSLFRFLFGGGASSSGAGKGLKELENFVDYVVRALVDNPDAIRVTSECGAESCVIKIDCRKEDIGKIVGKRGKTIMAIRSLVSGAAGRMQRKVTVEVVE